MLILQRAGKGFLPGTSPQTIEKVVKNRHLFVSKQYILHRVMADKSTLLYIPTHQQVDAILNYHQKWVTPNPVTSTKYEAQVLVAQHAQQCRQSFKAVWVKKSTEKVQPPKNLSFPSH